MPQESASFDDLEGQIIRCLQLSPRIPFRAIAEILGVSEQTIARRYRRLEREGLVRITALLRPAAVGQSNWMVRIQVRPSGADALARALAQRDDVSWVTLVAGGSEVVCVLRARTDQSRDDLLMQRLPRTTPVLGISAAMVLHRFVGVGSGKGGDWSGLAHVLTPEQTDAAFDTAVQPPLEDVLFDLTPEDHVILNELSVDGRASYARLAKAAGVSETRVARRLTALIEGGAAYFDVDMMVASLGLRTGATLWLTVSPSDLDAAGRALGVADEVPFAGAITGPTNLVASVLCRDVEDLYRFTTVTVGAIAGVQSMEISPVLRHIKQAGALASGNRLA